MDIISIAFEEQFVIKLNNELVKITAFETHEHGNIKFGIEAPRSINVHHEDIYYAIKEKNNQL